MPFFWVFDDADKKNKKVTMKFGPFCAEHSGRFKGAVKEVNERVLGIVAEGRVVEAGFVKECTWCREGSPVKAIKNLGISKGVIVQLD